VLQRFQKGRKNRETVVECIDLLSEPPEKKRKRKGKNVPTLAWERGVHGGAGGDA